jgi:phosphatidylglycerophosphate synthase
MERSGLADRIKVEKKQAFKGDKKHLIHFLVPCERMFLKAVLPLVPLQIGTAHLTLMTVCWAMGIVISGYLSQGDMRWLWAFNGFILMQYMTDMLDGEVGRTRHSGLIKWGFYMDHFLDYIFLCSIIIGYSFLLPPSYSFLTSLCLTFMAGFMVHAFMDFSITNNFKISCNQFGVSEMRLVLVIFNVLLMAVGKGLLIQIFPFVVMSAFIGLCLLVYTSQNVYRHIDALQQAQTDEVY